METDIRHRFMNNPRVANKVVDELQESGGGAVTDTTLSISGAPADAKAVGDALAEKADADDVTITSAEGAELLNIAKGEGGS